jgi:hypothetical protein
MAKKKTFWIMLGMALVFGILFTGCADNEISQPSEYVTFNGKITAKERDGTSITGEVRVTLRCTYPNDEGHENDEEKTVIARLDGNGKAAWEITGKRADFKKYDYFGIMFGESVRCDNLGNYRLSDSIETYDCGDMLFSPISGIIKEGGNPVSGRTLYVLEEPFKIVSDVWKDNPDKAVMSIWMGEQEEGQFFAHTQTPVSRETPRHVYFAVFQWGGNPDHAITTAKLSSKIEINQDGSTPEQDVNSWTELPFD